MKRLCPYKNFSIITGLISALKKITTHWLLITQSILALPAALITLWILINSSAYWFPYSRLLGVVLIIFILLIIPLFLGWLIGLTRVLLDIHDNGTSKLTRLIPPFKLALKYIAGSILYGGLIALGNVFFIIPGLIISVMYCFFDLCLYDNPSLGIWKSFQWSAQLSRKVSLKLSFYNLLSGLFYLLLGVPIYSITFVSLENIEAYELLKNTAYITFFKNILTTMQITISIFVVSLMYSLLRLTSIHIYRTLEDFEQHQQSCKELNEEQIEL